MRKIILLFSLLFILLKVDGQGIVLSGTVQDSHTKEPISYASVYFSSSGIGKLSDSAGNFSFYISDFVRDTLEVSYVGYNVFKAVVTTNDNNKNIIVQLERGGTNEEVIVRPKFNKGLFLWKKIMSKKKQYNRYGLSNFGYEAYNKLEVDIKNFKPEKAKKNFIFKPFSFVFDNIDSTSEKDPFLPAYLLESVSDYAYQSSPKRNFEHIKATNTKGFANESISKLMGVTNQNVNIYANYIPLMDKDFISPFNDNADVYYSFSVPDTQIVNDKKIFHFVFRPKRPGQNVFEGDAWVIGQTYQIQKISLYLGKDANINYIDRISLFQEFIPINDSIYFLSRDKFFVDFKVLGKKSLTLIGRKNTSYKNIVINSDSITSVLKNQNVAEVITSAADLSNQTDSAWSKLRHDTLSVNEQAIYTTIDKLLDMPKFKRLQRTLKFIGTGYKNVGNLEIGPWFNWISANAWEGTRFRFDLGTNTGFNKHIYLHGYLAYGTKDEKFKGQIEAYWIAKRDPRYFRFHLSYTNDIDNGISQIGEVSQDNVFSIAVRKPNITRKFIDVRDLTFDVFRELGKGFSTKLFLSHRQYTPLQNLPFKSAFPVEKGDALSSFEVALQLRFAYLEQFFEGDYFRYSLGTKYPIVEATISQGIPDVLNSAYSYTKFSISVRDKVKISPYGTLSYKAYAGKINGTLPFTFLENHPGNDIYYYNKNNFSLMSRFQYLSDQYAGFNVEHNFGSGIFRFTALTRKLKWRQFWNVKTLWGSLSDKNLALNNTGVVDFQTLNGGKAYIEIGTGIDNIFKILRLDLVWRVSPTPLPTNNIYRFGVFGSFHFQF